MKIWTLSDLHLFGDLSTFGSHIRVPEADVCVVAGDLSDDIEASFRWLGRVIRPHMPCMYVLGNHDFFGRTVSGTRGDARQLAQENRIILLDDDVIVGGSVRFVGGTLWTDFEIFCDSMSGDLEVTRRRRAGEVAMQFAAENMPEYQCSWIGSGDTLRHLAPQDTLEMHRATRAFIEEALARPFDGPTVVVTHHLPHRNSLLDAFAGGKLNPAFGSDLSDIIAKYQPALWIHGHTHASFDYRVGQTRVLCNPRGNGKGNPAFDWKMVAEVFRQPYEVAA
jgi:Icc-related predicted phosphoesterase